MSEVVQAWLFTADNKMGIFDCDFDAKLFLEGTATDVEEATNADDNTSSASPAPYGDTVVPTSSVDAISAHHIWVGFFMQIWQVNFIFLFIRSYVHLYVTSVFPFCCPTI